MGIGGRGLGCWWGSEGMRICVWHCQLHCSCMRVPPSNPCLPRCSQVWAVRENVSELVLGKSATYLPNGGFYQLTAALVAVAYGLSVVVPSGAHSCLPVSQHLLRALHRTLLTLRSPALCAAQCFH